MCFLRCAGASLPFAPFGLLAPPGTCDPWHERPGGIAGARMLTGWWGAFAFGLVVWALVECLTALPGLIRQVRADWSPASDAAWSLTRGRWE